MPVTVQSLGIDRLSREERLVLVQEIWETIAAEPAPPPLSNEQREELRRRLAAYQANPQDVVPWEVVKAQTLARLKS